LNFSLMKTEKRYSMIENEKKEEAFFGAGCFWGVEEFFRILPGVIETEVGYMGGDKENPTYSDVCTGKTGHAEVVRLLFDNTQISYKDLVSKFWKIHDPTTVNQQGPDIGHQYRSVIFFKTPKQELEAKKSKENIEKSGILKNQIVTEIIPSGKFYKAEEYHQKYLLKNGLSACHF